MARVRDLAANLLLSVAASAVFLGGAEVLARRLEPPRRAATREPSALDWDAEWHGEFYTRKPASADWPAGEEFNQDGLRDPPTAGDKPESMRRIVCLADSVTRGPDGHPEQAFPQQLQDRLDARAPGFEVFNVALWGWATRQERIAYERIARRYRPDQVLLGVC